MRGQGGDGDRLVDRIEPVDRRAVDDGKPRGLGEQVDPSGEGRGAADTLSCEPLRQPNRRFILADVALLDLRRHDARHPRLRQHAQPFGRDDVALLQRDSIDPHCVRENRPLGLADRKRAKFHGEALSERRGFLRNEAMISPMIETAISAGLTAPMSRPIGA